MFKVPGPETKRKHLLYDLDFARIHRLRRSRCRAATHRGVLVFVFVVIVAVIIVIVPLPLLQRLQLALFVVLRLLVCPVTVDALLYVEREGVRGKERAHRSQSK